MTHCGTLISVDSCIKATRRKAAGKRIPTLQPNNAIRTYAAEISVRDGAIESCHDSVGLTFLALFVTVADSLISWMLICDQRCRTERWTAFDAVEVARLRRFTPLQFSLGPYWQLPPSRTKKPNTPPGLL